MDRRRLTLSTVSLFFLVACDPAPEVPGDRADEPEAGSAADPAAGPVVATVDGVPISLAEVEDVARRTGITPREALTRLEEEVVLTRAAEADPAYVPTTEEAREIADVERRAAVQALLRLDIEDRIRPETMPADAVLARLTQDAGMFAQPERRASAHVLCRPNRDAPPEADAAAERTCRRILGELLSSPDPVAAIPGYAESNPARTFSVVTETLPPARRTGQLAEAYAAALFSRDTPGVVAELAHTSHGWHAIVLTEIVPPWEIPAEEAEGIVRRQLAVEARAEALIALEDRLMAEHPPVIDPRGAELALRPPVDDAPLEAP